MAFAEFCCYKEIILEEKLKIQYEEESELSYCNVNVALQEILDEKVIPEWFAFVRQFKTHANFQPLPVNEADEILETHYIPGRYLHFIKKNKRQLKKEAREVPYVGNKPVLRISARNSEYLKNEEEANNSGSDFSTTLNHTQYNLAQRLNRAIIKCNDQVPHLLINLSVIYMLKAAIEQHLHIHLAQYRTMLQRSMRVRKPPKILFCREDLQLGDINKILDQIEAEIKMNV
ncbi:1849_t:CDS:2, partial [Racocetra fulgida]